MATSIFTNTQDLITKFELQVSDITELSGKEELDLANRIYFKICDDRPWEFLKTQASGTISTDASGAFIPIPTDFSHFIEDNQMTDNTYTIDNNAAPKVVYIINGTTYIPYQIINYSDRRKYVTRTGFCYLDTANSVIRFTGGVAPQYTSYEFDYIKRPATLTLTTGPVFPSTYWELIVFGMATDNDIIQLSDKSKSYEADNDAKYQSLLLDMQNWNSKLINN